MNNFKVGNQKFKLINWKSIVIGSLITFIGFFIAFKLFSLIAILKLDPNLTLISLAILVLAPLIAGCIVAYMNKPTYKSGIIYGLLATIIGIILFNLFSFLLGNGTMILFIIVAILSILGAFIGTSIKKLEIQDNN